MPRATTSATTVAAALVLSVVVPACEGLETALERLTDVDGTLSIDVSGTFQAGGRAA
jgi:hypothetical protein